MVKKADEESGKQPVWESLSDAGLVEIRPDEFPDRIRDVKNLVIGRLSELLQINNQFQEREFAAYSLGTLRKLEKTLRGKTPDGAKP